MRYEVGSFLTSYSISFHFRVTNRIELEMQLEAVQILKVLFKIKLFILFDLKLHIFLFVLVRQIITLNQIKFH